MAPFDGRSALIFGGGRNIGRVIAHEFARRGARLAIADIDEGGAQQTASEIIASGGVAMAVACDVSDQDSVRKAAAAAEAQVGDIDILMNNAGVLHNGNPEDIPIDEWHRMFNVNFMSIVHSTRYFIPKMIERRHGYIVNTASIAGVYPFGTSRMPYCASKAAIVSLTQNLAIYLIPKGVSVSCLIPGPTATSAMSGLRPFSDNVIITGPGSGIEVKTPQWAASTLADGMHEGRIMIWTHEEVGPLMMRELAAAPDEFIRRKIREFESGDPGMPTQRAVAE